MKTQKNKTRVVAFFLATYFATSLAFASETLGNPLFYQDREAENIQVSSEVLEENAVEAVLTSEKLIHPQEVFEDVDEKAMFASADVVLFNEPRGSVVGQISPFDSVIVNGENQSGYLRAQYKQMEVYLLKDNMVEKREEIFRPVNKKMYAKQEIGVRKEPGGEVIQTVKKNSLLHIVAENNEYSKIQIGNTTGYVWTDYLTNKKTGEYKTYTISDPYQYQVVLATVRHEGGNSYEGALSVMSTILNRADSGKWGGGNDPYRITIAPGQFESYLKGRYKPFMGYNVSPQVRQGVEDALNGKRSHRFESFRTNSAAARSKRPWGIAIAGNYFF